MHQKIDGNLEYIYHAVPEMMSGETLYPLNTLRKIYPEAYEYAVRKYDWRRDYLELTIPKLDCLWNDVLHFSMIHPHEIFKEFEAAGYLTDSPTFSFVHHFT